MEFKQNETWEGRPTEVKVRKGKKARNAKTVISYRCNAGTLVLTFPLFTVL